VSEARNQQWTLDSQGLRLVFEQLSDDVLRLTLLGTLTDQAFQVLAPEILHRLEEWPNGLEPVYVCVNLKNVVINEVNIRRKYIADLLARGRLVEAVLVYNHSDSISNMMNVLDTAPNRVPVILTTEEEVSEKIRHLQSERAPREVVNDGRHKLPKFDLSPLRIGLQSEDLCHTSPDGSTRIVIKHLEASIYEQFRTIGPSREQHKGEPDFIEKILRVIIRHHPQAKVSFLVNVQGLTDLSLSSRKGLMDLHKRLPVVGAVAFVGANVLVGRALGWGFQKFTHLRFDFFSEREEALTWLRSCYESEASVTASQDALTRTHIVSESQLRAVQSLLSEIAWGQAPSQRYLDELEHSSFLPIRTSIELLRADIIEINEERDRQAADRVRINRELRDAITNIAHDIRTPLTSLKLGLGRLKYGEPYSDVGPTLHAEVCHLDGLFDNLSLMLGRNVLPVRSNRSLVNLVDLCLRVQIRFELLASDRNLALELGADEDSVMAFADEIPMEQAIGNVVHNAIGFAYQHVAIVVMRDAEYSIVRVDDDGPGIDLEDTTHLKARYGRGRTHEKHERQGYGLGLSIALMVVEEHGGTLELSNLEDGGTRVELRLPHYNGHD